MPTNVKKRFFTSFLENPNFVKPYEIIENQNNSYSMPTSIEDEDINFSFNKKTDGEFLKNPNIIENSIKEETNSNLKINKSFDNSDDAIYDLDEKVDIIYDNKNDYKKNIKQNVLSNKFKNKKTKLNSRY